MMSNGPSFTKKYNFEVIHLIIISNTTKIGAVYTLKYILLNFETHIVCYVSDIM